MAPGPSAVTSPGAALPSRRCRRFRYTAARRSSSGCCAQPRRGSSRQRWWPQLRMLLDAACSRVSFGAHQTLDGFPQPPPLPPSPYLPTWQRCELSCQTGVGGFGTGRPPRGHAGKNSVACPFHTASSQATSTVCPRVTDARASFAE